MKNQLHKDAFDILKNGLTLGNKWDEFKYLDHKKYRGKGRPRNSDYSQAKPLFKA